MIALERLPDVFNLGGLERISRFEFGKLVMDVFNLRNAKLNPFPDLFRQARNTLYVFFITFCRSL